MTNKKPAVLGIFVTDSSLEAVLMRRSDDQKVHIVGRYVKQRSRRGERIADLAAVIPGLRETTATDYTMEIGDGSGQTEKDIFLSGELEALGVPTSGDNGKIEPRFRTIATPFGTQLREILADCRADGYESPSLAFCLGSTDIAYHELGLPIPRERQALVGSTRDLTISKAQRKALLQKLGEAMPPALDKSRVGFVPMTDENNRWRYFAVAPFSPDPVGEALDLVARKTKTDVPRAHVVDSEATLLLSLVKRRVDSRIGVVGIVRVSASETTIIFLDNGRLDRYEHLRSLTSYDPVDTVCSRVLLKQDELKIGELDALFVATEHHSEDAVETFQSYFPDTVVHGLSDLLEPHNLAANDHLSAIRANTLPAIGIGLRLIEKWGEKDRDHELINLLDKKRRGARTRRTRAVRWHSYAAMVVLFFVALFYTGQYTKQQEQIDRKEAEIALDPPEFPTENPALLRSQVDSLQSAYVRYNRALLVLDSLLIGSDQWSTTLEKMTRSTRDIGSIWLKAWTPGGGAIRVEGNALQRSRIARLAQDWDGSIDKLNFAEIQGIRIYSFSMTIPLEPELPRVAQYLRENSLEELDPGEAEALAGMAQAASHTHSE